MHKIFTALALSLALLPAWADHPPATPATDALKGGLIQANLVVVSPQGAPRKAEATALKGSLPADDDAPPADDGESHHTSSGMLLAALVLMAGIVLRRWGGGER